MTTKLKIASLNLWRYYDWDKRYKNIVQALRRSHPDVIAFQEVQLNSSFSPKPQSVLLAEALGYRYHSFAPTSQKYDQIDNEGAFTQNVSHGLAFISKYPIISSESIFLGRYSNDHELRSIQLITLLIEGQEVYVCNVHFDNSDEISSLHLKETLDIVIKRQIKPIILGDFNIYDIKKYDKLFSNYTLSSDMSDYISYPKREGTLDYILTPNGVVQMLGVECLTDQISDHRLVLASLVLRQK